MRRSLLLVAVLFGLLVHPLMASAATPTSFAARVDYAVGNRPLNVALSDVNADSRLDIVVANAYSDNVSVLLGDGTGRFATASQFVSGDGPVYAAIGDVTGDGKADIVAANEFADSVSLLTGDGTGRFGAPRNLAGGNGPDYVALGRLNADGLPDIVTTDWDGDSISLLMGSGVGAFSAATTSSAGDGPHGRLADANGDGRLDLIVCDYYTNSVLLRLGDGTGRFSAGTSYAVGKAPVGNAEGDLNGDGTKDLLVGNYGGNTVSVLMGAGGAFTRTLDYPVGANPTALALSDLNGDGALDAVTSNYSSGNLSILLGDGAGRFTRDADRAVGARPWGVAAGDLNGDGRPDLVSSNAASATVSVMLNTTQATQPVSGSVSINGGSAYTATSAVTLTMSASGSPTQVMVSDNSGFRGATWQAFSASIPWNLAAGDGTRTVYVKFRNGSGTESSVASASILVDSVAPATSRGSLPTGWVNANQTLTLSAADSGSGVAGTSYRLTPPGSASAYTEPVIISAEGSTDIEYWSVDRAGNTETVKATQVRIDKTAPRTTSNAQPSYIGEATITLSATDALSGVASTSYSLDGGAVLSGTTVTASGFGSHTLVFNSRDNAGNVEPSVTVTFFVGVADSRPPTTTISPVLPGWVNGDVVFTLTAVDDISGVAATYYRLSATGPLFTYSQPAVLSAEGVNMVQYRSVDRMGNSETTLTASYRIDKTAPTTVSDVKGSYSRTATVQLRSTDALSGVEGTYYRLDGGTVTRGTTVITSVVGGHTLTFWAVDLAGNPEPQKTVRFKVRR